MLRRFSKKLIEDDYYGRELSVRNNLLALHDSSRNSHITIRHSHMTLVGIYGMIIG